MVNKIESKATSEDQLLEQVSLDRLTLSIVSIGTLCASVLVLIITIHAVFNTRNIPFSPGSNQYPICMPSCFQPTEARPVPAALAVLIGCQGKA